MSSSALSEPDVDAGAPIESTNKRRSGRVSRRPDLFAATSTASKRKRPDRDDDAVANDDDDDNEDEVDDEDDDDSDGEPDEEEVREKRARARKAKTAPQKKPAAKRAKPNGTSLALPVRTQVKPRRKKAKALNEEEAEQAGGLYGPSSPTLCEAGSA